ncbi:MAG: hypothetical protein Kow0042_13550 [Calditrichia bacterium]
MKILLPILVLFLSLGISADSSEPFQFRLPNYSYHQFPNSFELILVENHTNPLIATVVVIRTGLRNESAQNNGVSHMLEHMTFNGTRRRTQKELYDELDYFGIYLNAQTSEDYTTFMALYHKDQTSPSLDILSDMLFHSTFPEEKFEKEKGIIAEEIRKDSEAPDFIKELKLRQDFYRDLPYAMPVIGTVETVRQMSRQQVLEYYRKYYAPNNMIALVIGDFDKSEMLDSLKKYFGSEKPKKIEKRRFSLQQTFPYLYRLEEENDQTVYLKFPAPTFYSDDFIPFQFLYSYFISGQESEISQSLLQDSSLRIKKLRTSYQFHPEFGELTFQITSAKGVDPQKLKTAVQQALAHLNRKEFSDVEIAATKRQMAISEMLQLEKILYYGFLKAQELAIAGIDAYEKMIPAFLQLRKETIARCRSFDPALWKSPQKLFAKGSWWKKVNAEPYLQPVSRIVPGEGRIHRSVLPNGLTVLHYQNQDNPVLALHILFKNRSALEPEGKTGIADFLHHCLFKASAHYPADSLQLLLKKIGAEIKAYDWAFIPYDDYYNVPQYSYIRFVTLDQFFQEAVRVTADNILHPDLAAAFPDAQRLMTQLAAQSENNPRKQAQLNFFKGLWGEDHPWTKPVSGTMQSVQSITVADLEAFHKKYFSAENTIISVVSGLDSATVFNTIHTYFQEMPRTADTVTIPSPPVTQTVRSNSMSIGSRQAYIYLGYTFKGDTSDELPLEILNQMLSDQIAFSLREQKGWAYSLGSVVAPIQDKFYLYVYMGTGRETLHPAIRELLQEISIFKEREIDQTLLERTKNSMVAALTRRRASRESQAYTLGLNEFHQHDPADYHAIFEKIRRISLNDVLRVRKYLQNQNYYLFYTLPKADSDEGSRMPMMPPGMGR